MPNRIRFNKREECFTYQARKIAVLLLLFPLLALAQQESISSRASLHRSDAVDIIADCGAVGLAHDDTAAIQACINRFPLDTLLFPKRATTIGGCDYTISAPLIQPPTTSGQGFVGASSQETFVCSRSDTTGLVLQGSLSVVRNMAFMGNRGWNGVTGGAATFAQGMADGLELRNEAAIYDSRISNFSRHGLSGITGNFRIASVVVSRGIATITTATPYMTSGSRSPNYVTGESPILSSPNRADGFFNGAQKILSEPSDSTFTIATKAPDGRYCAGPCFVGGQNVSTSSATNLMVGGNRGDGIHVDGSDSNTMRFSRIWARVNAGWGIWDESEFGNTYEANTEANGNDPNSPIHVYKVLSATRANNTLTLVTIPSDENYPITFDSLVVAHCADSSLNRKYWGTYVTGVDPRRNTITIVNAGGKPAASAAGCTVGRQEGSHLRNAAGLSGGSFHTASNTVSFPKVDHLYTEVGNEPPPQFGNTTIVTSTNAYPDLRFNSNNVTFYADNGILRMPRFYYQGFDPKTLAKLQSYFSSGNVGVAPEAVFGFAYGDIKGNFGCNPKAYGSAWCGFFSPSYGSTIDMRFYPIAFQFEGSGGGRDYDTPLMNQGLELNDGSANDVRIKMAVAAFGVAPTGQIPAALGDIRWIKSTASNAASYYQCTAVSGKNCSTWTPSFLGLRSGVAGNTDLTGRVALVRGTATYTLNGAYKSAPNCIAQDATTPANAASVLETTRTLTFTGTGSDVIKYICAGRN